MGLFSFGGSKQSSSRDAQSSAFDFSQSGQVSGGVSGSESQQRVAFEDIFARLFSGAEGAAAGLDPSLLTDAANQLFSGGLGFLDTLSGGPGTDFLTSRVAGSSPVLDEQIGLLEEDVGRFFNEQLLPGITSEAVAVGGLGGARQGIAETGAAREASSAFSRGATALRAGDIEARDRAAGVLGNQRIASAATGLAELPALAGLADMGFGAGLAPAERLAAILGGPTVLGESFASAEDFARGFSQSFGASQATDTSRSSGQSVRFGFGSAT